MTSSTQGQKRLTRRPKIVLDEPTLARLEALADGAAQRNPALADRLLDEIARARIVAAGKLPASVVAVGRSVTYHDEAAGREKTVMLVFPEDADIGRNRISVMTPIGVALIGLAEGATFYWDTRDNQRRTLKVIRVAPAVDPAIPR